MLCKRLGASLRRHGVAGTARLLPRRLKELGARWVDPLYDALRGVSTRGVTELDRLHITSPNKARGIRYEPTLARPLARLLATLNLPKTGAFIDFGCGKGRVLLMALAHGFRDLVGVDFSEELCDIATRNLSRYADRARIEIVHADAVDLPIRDDVTVFYFFNPFDHVVMQRVLDNIVLSMESCPREIFVIYHNPVWREVLDASPRLKEFGDYEWDGCRFLVYRGY